MDGYDELPLQRNKKAVPSISLDRESNKMLKVWASVNQQTIPDQTIVSTTSQVNKDSSLVHYQTMV